MTVIASLSARAALPPLAGLLLVLACTGCGGPHHEPAKPGAVHHEPAPTGASSQSPARKPAFPEAADGTDVRACRDGSCEILATKRVKIPLASRFGYKTFSFDPADAKWRFAYSAGGSGSLSFDAPPFSGSWAAPTGEESLTLTVVATDGSKAVISLRPKK